MLLKNIGKKSDGFPTFRLKSVGFTLRTKGVSPATETKGSDENATLKKLIQNAKTFGEALYLKKDKLFNSLPSHIRNITNCTRIKFKRQLDRFLSTLPDEPLLPNYYPYRIERIQTVLKKWWIIGFPNWMIERLKEAIKSIKSKYSRNEWTDLTS